MTAHLLALAEELKSFNLDAHRFLDAGMKAQGASLARVKLLLFIERNTSVRSTDLVESFGFAPRTITEAIDGLEREGFVCRVADPKDRRVKNIILTDAGRAVIRQVDPFRLAAIDAIFGVFSREEVAEFSRLLAKVNRHLATLSPIAIDIQAEVGA
jgi:DNA-binding MarR family transcriptional regulator